MGADVELQLPEEVSFSQGFLMAGHIEGLPGLEAPVLVNPAAAELGQGTLRVCPTDQGGDVLETIAQLRNECQDQELHENPILEFGLGTVLRFDGTFDAPADQEAAIAAFDGAGHWLVMVSNMLRLDSSNGIGFAAISAKSVVTVVTDDGASTYAGNEWVFFHESTATTWDVDGYGAIGETDSIRLEAAPRNEFHQLGDPFLLLELQEGMLGKEGRERRADVASIVNQFGRIPDLVNGAVYGHLNGTVGQHSYDGSLAMVRFENATLAIDGTTFTGSGQPLLVIREGAVGTGGRNWEPLWWLGAILWVAAIVSSAYRRYPVPAEGARRWANAGAGLLAFLIIDLYVFWRLAGAAALATIFRGDRLGVIMDVTGITVVTHLVSWFVFLVPLRLVLRKFIPGKWAWGADGIAVLAYIIVLFVSPAAMLAGANDVLRF